MEENYTEAEKDSGAIGMAFWGLVAVLVIGTLWVQFPQYGAEVREEQATTTVAAVRVHGLITNSSQVETPAHIYFVEGDFLPLRGSPLTVRTVGNGARQLCSLSVGRCATVVEVK